MIRETKEEAKIRYTLRPTPPKAHKNNATNTPCAHGEATRNAKNRTQRLDTVPIEMIAKTVKSANFPI